MKITTKQTLEALQRFAGKGDARYYLNGILCGEDHMTATNGSILLQTRYADFDPAEFPDAVDNGETLDGAILDRDMVADAIKTAKPHKVLPILDNTVMIQRGGERLKATMTSHSGERSQNVAGKLIDGKFPAFDHVINPPDGAQFASVVVDPEFLIDLGTAIKKIGIGRVELRVNHDEESPMHFAAGDLDNPQARGVIMPMRR